MREGYYPHIDGMRAIAVLAVMAYHLRPAWLPGGFTGVDVFFVLSGFVVSASVARSPDFKGPRGALWFYARRARRILPALFVCLLATAVASALFIPESWLSETSGKTGRMAFLGLSNWVLAGTGNSYFSPRSEFNPYTHTWSLGVEEQFYLLFPLLFLAGSRGRKGRGLSLLLFALATVASLAHAVFLAHQGGHETEAFYRTTTRFWQLGAGVLLFQVLHMRAPTAAAAPRPGARYLRPLLLLASLLALGYGLWAARPGHSPWGAGVWPVAGTLGLLAALHRSARGWVGASLSSVPMVAIGRMSYSLYLWHWPVFVLFRWTLGLDSAGTGAAAVLCTVLLSWLSWRWVEQPLRFGACWRARDARWVACGLAIMLLGMGVQKQVSKNSRHLSLSVVTRHPLDWYPYAEGVAKAHPECRLVVSRLPGGVQQFERGACPSGTGGGRRLFVVGDSHALAYAEMFGRLALQDGVQVRLDGRGGCTPIGLQAWQLADRDCTAHVRALFKELGRHVRPGDTVFLPGLRVPRLVEQYRQFDPAEVRAAQQGAVAQARRGKVVAGAIAYLRPLARRGVHIVLEAPKPVLPAPPFRCSDVFNRGNPICSRGMTLPRAEMDALREPALSALQEIAAALPGASLWDPLPVLCPGSTCLPDDDGKPLYFDGDHLSGYGNRVLLPSFRDHLMAREE
ncbi:acyltransferase family protein [Stenotrophomonas mori]|uniref:Acyltransferase n=1 Tax=Stenotrophomonas mori TaxID=2871096 RepID=A0ABT0SE84_9GAMM|nr:acyltransferase family protein [Stenotrophomonas mori]MCL7713618.1 acyltransferase [Stenotrophomonas mori]